MKKLFQLLTAVFICVSMCSCNMYTAESPQAAELPSVPESFFTVTEITAESMQVLESKVQRLTVTDFLHTEKIAQLEKQGIMASVKNITLLDCNNISFDLVLKLRFGSSITLPAKGILMYGYVPTDDERIFNLNVAWGNVTVTDNIIALANIDTLSFWNAETMESAFRQPKIDLADDTGYFFIQDIVKGENGFTMPYFSSESCGLVNIGLTGDVFSQPVKYESKSNTVFGTVNFSENSDWNTTARVRTMLNCCYLDETENQFMISLRYADGYFGTDYVMYDFTNHVFVSSVDVLKCNVDDYSYNLYSMCLYDGIYYRGKNTLYVAEKYKDGRLERQTAFNTDISGLDFGRDKATGWNTLRHLSLSEDYNNLHIGCSRSGTAIDIDFTRNSAVVSKTVKMPQMHLLKESPNTGHRLYKVWDKNDTVLAVRSMMGNFEMDGIARVHGQQGTDWLADFYTHNYIYVLTQDGFSLFRWEGGNKWVETVCVTGSFNVDANTAARICAGYSNM